MGKSTWKLSASLCLFEVQSTYSLSINVVHIPWAISKLIGEAKLIGRVIILACNIAMGQR